MPLSENEQRLLEQMERALYAEDPKFASAMRGSRRRSGVARRLTIGALGLVLGLVLLLVGVIQGLVILGALGFILMLAGTVYAVSGPRKSGPKGVVTATGGVQATRARPKRPFMQRLEERWERRRDER